MKKSDMLRLLGWPNLMIEAALSNGPLPTDVPSLCSLHFFAPHLRDQVEARLRVLHPTPQDWMGLMDSLPGDASNTLLINFVLSEMGPAVEQYTDQLEPSAPPHRPDESADQTDQPKPIDQTPADSLLDHLRLECQLLNAIPDDDEEEVQVWCAFMDVMVGAIEGEPRESAMILLRDTDLHFLSLWDMIRSFVEEADDDEEKEARIHALDTHLRPFLMRVLALAHNFREYKDLLYYWPTLQVQRRLCLTASQPKDWVFIWRQVPEIRMRALALGRLMQLTTD